jgi:hypothetical protein
MSFYRDQLEDYLSELDVKATRVLDIGGASNPVKDRVKSWDVADYKILDDCSEPAKASVDYIIEIENAYKVTTTVFNLIFCLEVAEYFSDPVKAVQNISSLADKDCRLIITFPFVYPQHNPIGTDFFRYTKNGVKLLLEEKGGFTVDNIIPRRAKTPTLQRYYAEDGMHPAKCEDHDVTGWIVEATR